MKWRKQRNKPVSSVHPLNQMSEGCSQGSLNWPLNTGLTGLKVNQEKMMVGKSVHYKMTPIPQKVLSTFPCF